MCDRFLFQKPASTTDMDEGPLGLDLALPGISSGFPREISGFSVTDSYYDLTFVVR